MGPRITRWYNLALRVWGMPPGCSEVHISWADLRDNWEGVVSDTDPCGFTLDTGCPGGCIYDDVRRCTDFIHEWGHLMQGYNKWSHSQDPGDVMYPGPLPYWRCVSENLRSSKQKWLVAWTP